MTVTNLEAEIHAVIVKTLADALGINSDTVTDETDILRDLGADSIDILDILFHLENNLDDRHLTNGTGIRFEISPFASNLAYGNIAFTKEGAITPEGLRFIQEHLSYINPDRIEKGVAGNVRFTYVTVRDLKDFIAWFIQKNPYTK